MSAICSKILENAREIAKEVKAGAVGTEHLLLSILKTEEGLAYAVLTENGVKEKDVRALIEKYLLSRYSVMEFEGNVFSPMASKALQDAERIALSYGCTEIASEHILMALLNEPTCSACKLLGTLRISYEKLKNDLNSFSGAAPAKNPTAQKTKGNPARSATSTLDQYSRDLTKMAEEGSLDPVIGRDQEIQAVIQILSRRTKNNPCLIGEPGVGKTAVVEGLAARIVEGNVPDVMRGKRIVSLDLSSMVAGSKYRGEFEERIKNVIREVAEDRSVILFIDEFHTIIGAGSAEGALDAANIIKPSLSRGELQIIGATTITEYRKHIEKDAALERRFQPVTVHEPTEEETLAILKGLRKLYEDHHKVHYTDEALEAAVSLSKRYISERFLPDKAIDLVDEAGSRVHLSQSQRPKGVKRIETELEKVSTELEQAVISQDYKTAFDLKKQEEKLKENLTKAKERQRLDENEVRPDVTDEDIRSVVSAWTKIPVDSLKQTEASRLKNLESILAKRIVSQKEAVAAVSKAIRRGRVGLKNPKRPIGSFLFLGPTGVGKTELSKALSEAVFGSEQNMIRVDMSEYMEKHSVSKLIGSPPGYVGFEEGGQLSEKVRRNPYSVLLFDEIEKAHPDVFHILLQVLDDGQITDSQGRRVDFKNTVIIMTSNLGAESIVAPKNLGFGSKSDEKQDYERMKEKVLDAVKKNFKPEFLNRIDEILVFHSLTKEDMKSIVEIMLKELQKRCRSQLGISLNFMASAKAYLIDKGYDPKYGARPLRRAIQTLVEDELSEKLLSGEFAAKDVITVSKGENGLRFTKRQVK
ncbi:MAG: ATP-dependent Clp protease ATP-binding subunit [Lachnospiraceae bacterium]|nr:ATP-dependent Clp protease ATP-binding subunit [Lachnospiraceae bacterium]MBR5738697.1 ATP-dependent Clp protease ATP-binding subunit [Lachnospiraceae bacterium]